MAADTPPISKLGDDLLEKILIRSFPNPRSAGRSKPVCKRWNSLISHAGFNRGFVFSPQKQKQRHAATSAPLQGRSPAFAPKLPPRTRRIPIQFRRLGFLQGLASMRFSEFGVGLPSRKGPIALDLQSIYESMGRPFSGARNDDFQHNEGSEIDLSRISKCK
ncbi:unnamed protein product [Linum tenue]|uniref:F-box domain-containing protein n=1 Tax=Linum tenue TaxID=586396 RepID=A0AAV0ITY7_9ROSI|nr:unnamed protein product [Linum tenue]